MKTTRQFIYTTAIMLAVVAAPAQTFTVLKSFGPGDGLLPNGGLVVSGNTLYGTAHYGGTTFWGGTDFKMNTDGSGFTVLKDFTNGSDGLGPWAGVTLSEGWLYGTTAYGGTNDLGTVFKMRVDGTGYTVLKNFSDTDSGGVGPTSTLRLSGTTLYETTPSGGTWNGGGVFKVNTDGTGFAVLKEFLLGGIDESILAIFTNF